MARKLRLEYPGAIYHVINRGNYRRDVFETVGAAQSFVQTLEEAVALYGWRLQAYALMSNHFHLVVETPQPNLTEGMHWLMSTTATRFNRFRQERGHLFQGRYQALPIEDARVMGHVIDYVHLNPVRAQVVEASQVGAFRWSSLARFLRGPRFAGLDPEGALNGRGWSDTPDGWSGYVEHLIALAANQEEQKRLGYEAFSTGWAIGGTDWQRTLAAEHKSMALTPGLASQEARALREAQWRELLDKKLRETGRNQTEALAAPKTAPWKLKLAQSVRTESGASVSWLTRELALGAEGTARSMMSRSRNSKIQ
ncbi:transposase [Rariglobus hedericola]|uniref:Transposase n=1 Tax=Rariglobus hedericola TaxID=2597822 RepID=A0A556QN49_9BACT|nr:transposase [Rariglobus hedericola]TSJ78078.1 transposase [Rariglobus hedericola]